MSTHVENFGAQPIVTTSSPTRLDTATFIWHQASDQDGLDLPGGTS
jgi:hypothetical protein